MTRSKWRRGRSRDGCARRLVIAGRCSTARCGGGAGVVMWSASARDFRPGPPERVIRSLRRARGGDIVLLHDGDFRVLEGDRRRTVEALEHWLPRWKRAGIRFVTLDELQARH